MQFSINRVWLLSKKQWVENRQLYLLGLLATAGILGVVFLAYALQREGLSLNNQENIFIGGLGISGGIFTSTILSKFNDKIKGIQILTLPASALEKLITAIIYAMLIFPAAYCLVTYPVMAFVHYIDTNYIGHISLLYNVEFHGHFIQASLIYLALQAMVLVCSVLFKRYTILKTTVLIIMVVFLITAINPYIAERMLDTKSISNQKVNMRQILYNEAGDQIRDTMSVINVAKPVLQPSAPYGSAYMYFREGISRNAFDLLGQHVINLGVSIDNTGKFIFDLLGILVVPFLWMVTWFRLKETEL